jgi:hypothetical protein
MLIRSMLAAGAALLAAGAAVAKTAAAPALLVIGVPHFGNPGRDMSNTKVENVLTPLRQREIVQLVDRLAAFRPNHVVVEWPATDQAGLDKRYADYRAGRIKLQADERDQIGLRLAAKLNLPRVDAVDWNDNPPGADADYAFDDWLKARGRYNDYTDLVAATQRRLDAYAARNRCRPVADWLREINGKAYRTADEAEYFRFASFGDAKSNPGAAWVGAWYARNLRIVANIQRVAGKPGDRTIAVFGAGHAPLLDRYGTGFGFSVADTLAALPPASRPRC